MTKLINSLCMYTELLLHTHYTRSTRVDVLLTILWHVIHMQVGNGWCS